MGGLSLGLSTLALTGMRAGGGGGASLPAGALYDWNFANAQSSPRPYVPNSISPSEAAPANLIAAPRRLFNNTNLWAKTNLTVTDANATAPDGTTSASTITNGGTAWTLAPTNNTSGVYPAGTYRVWASMRWKGTGSTDFRIGRVGTTALKTTSASWARFSSADIVLASPGPLTAIIQSPDGTSAANFEICDFMVGSGSADPMPDWQANPLTSAILLGPQPGYKTPTVASGAVDLSTGNFGIIQFPAARTPTAVTVMTIGQRIGNGSGSGYEPFLTQIQDWNQFAIMNEANNSSPTIKWNGSSVTQTLGSTAMFDAKDNGWGAFTHRYDGATASSFYDDFKAWTNASTKSAASFADLFLGIVSTAAFYGGYKVARIIIWERALSDAEVLTAKAAAYAGVAANGIARSTWKPGMGEGDSIMAGSAGVSHIYTGALTASPRYHGPNVAVGGSTIAGCASRVAANLLYFSSLTLAGRVPFVFIHVGTNDLHPSGGPFAGNPNGALAALAAVCTSYRNAGVRTIVSTMLDRNDAGASATWAADKITYNAGILAGVGTSWDAAVNYDTEPLLSNPDGVTAANSATNFAADKIHPIPAGYALMLAKSQAVVDTMGIAA